MGTMNARRRPRPLLVLLAVGCLASPAGAQVVLDGTTGPAGALRGPDHAIGARE